MKSSIQKAAVLAFILVSGFLLGQDYSGEFSIQNDDGQVALTLQNNQGSYTGSLTGDGLSYPIQGKVQDGMLSGNVGDEWDGILFQAQLNGDELNFVMVEIDENGNPDYETAQTLIFRRGSQNDIQQKNSEEEQEEQKQGEVIINNKALTKEQIEEIEETYGVKPKPGKYWYDAKSGLYGVVGYQAYGFMLPNHNFGSMDRNASNGNTGVFVNGREIPMAEYTVWSSMVGSWIQPGSYWLDHAGNAGYEGNLLPVINLYQAARQRAYGGSGGGDSQWNTRFSAGNYDSGNTRGYVSVPGYGPVGYGF